MCLLQNFEIWVVTLHPFGPKIYLMKNINQCYFGSELFFGNREANNVAVLHNGVTVTFSLISLILLGANFEIVKNTLRAFLLAISKQFIS